MKTQKYRWIVLVFTLGYLLFGFYHSVYATNYPEKNINVQEIADFLGIPSNTVSLECPQKTYGTEGYGKDKFLFFCLRQRDNQKRCEIAISGLDRLPATYRIGVDIMEKNESPSVRWHSVMQLHSSPDKGEKWRCPPLSLEVYQGKYRAFNRWDSQPISKTYENNCTEDGSSIKARTILEGTPVKYDNWQRIFLHMDATPYKSGRIKLNIENKNRQWAYGENMFNDVRPPFLKLGIYKPSGWDSVETKAGKPICVGYRNLKIESRQK